VARPQAVPALRAGTSVVDRIRAGTLICFTRNEESFMNVESRRRRLALAVMVCTAAVTAGTAGQGGGFILVANRGSSSFSVIDPASDEVVKTVALPAGANVPEPMYIVDGGRGRVFVGDRANRRVVVFDRRFRPIATLTAGAGVFHMWAGGGQVWVNNDIDMTSSVFDVDTLVRLAVVPMPADLVAQGGRPHDVVLDAYHGRYAYVTMVGIPGANDYVVKFSTRTFAELARVPVGKDPHIAINSRHEQLFVPAQGSSTLHVLDTGTLEPLATLPTPGTHGAAVSPDSRRFYTTNLPGGGADALFTIDARSATFVGEPADAPFATPHNIALTSDGRKLYVTHSGPAASQVTVFRVVGPGMRPAYETTVTVGTNPFGIAFVR
jgi:YVTN family beta-propeller protein